MSSIEAVEQFVGAHRGCGSLTPSTSSAGPGGYLLTLNCSCGKVLERWITPDEAESGPGPIPSSSPPAKAAPPPPGETPQPEPSAIDITTAATGGESLEDVMKLALDALETPKAPPSPPTPPAPSTAPPPARRVEPAPRPAPLRGPDGESLEDVMKLALDAIDTPTAPPTPPNPPAPSPATPAPRAERRVEPAPPPAPRENLEDVMKLALDAIDTPKAPPPSAPTAPAPVESRVEPPAPPPPSATSSATAAAPAERRVERPPSAPPAPPAPTAPSAATPPPPPPRPVTPPPGPPRRARRDDVPKPDRGSLEDALRATLQALDSGADLGVEPDVPSTAPAAPTRGRPLPSRQAPAPAADARGGGRQTPDKESLQNALRATLSALEAERKAAPPGSRPLLGTPLRASPPARRKKKLSVKGALGIVVLLAAAVGAGYGLRELGQPPAETIVARPAPRVRIAANERAAVGQVMAVLRDVQSVSRTDVSYRVYFNRVSFAKGDVERSLANVKEADLRAALNDAMSVHVFAANVWRAKTLNEREKWEAVGEDPSVELCPGAKRILAIGDEPANMSRAQWRGIALAAGLPLLWDCAAERLAEVERGLSK